MSTPQTAASSVELSNEILTAISTALAGLRFGQVTIIVQDGRVMQIDRTDRRRLNHEPLPAQAELT